MGLHTVRFYLKWRTELWQFFSSKILDHNRFTLVRSLIYPVINVIVILIHSIWKGKSLGWKYLKVYRLCNVMKRNLRFVNWVNFLSSIHSSDMFDYYGKEGINGTINVLHKKMSWKIVCSQSWHRVFVLLHSAFVEAKGWKSFQRSVTLCQAHNPSNFLFLWICT